MRWMCLAIVGALSGPAPASARDDGLPARVEAPEPIVVLRVEHYDSDASARADAAGKALLSFTFSHETIASREACALRKVQVVLDATLVVPRPAHVAGVSVTPLQRTEQWARGVESHEQTHYRIALAAAKELTRSLSETPPAAQCAQVERELRRRKREFEERHWQLQQEFHRRERMGIPEDAAS